MASSEALQQGENIAIVVAEMTNKPCEIEVSSDNAASLHMIRNGSGTTWPTAEMAADNLTKGLGASRLPQIRENLCQQVLNPTPLNPTPATCHKRKRKLRCNFRTATLAFLQCGSHLDQKLRCNKRKTALQHRKSCVAGKWRFPAAFLRASSPHV